MVQITPGIKAFRHFVFGKLGHTELNLHIAPLCYLVGVLQGLGRIGEQCLHLLLGLAVVLPALIAHAVLILHLLAGLDAQQYIVGLLILCKRIVDIIGGHQFKPCLPAHAHQSLIDQFLVGQPMVLQFQEKVVLSKYVHIPSGCPHSLLVHAPGKISLHLAGQAGAQCNHPLVVLGKHLIIHPGFIIKTIHKSLGHNLHQVLISLVVLCQKHQMIVPVLAADRLPVKAGVRRHIDLTAKNRLNTCFLCSFIKINHTIHHTVVRNSHAVHPKFFGPGRQLLDLAGAV